MAIKTGDGGSTVVMSDEQINRLPNICRIIIRHARDIEDMCSNAVVSFDEFRKQRSIMRGYVREAARIYMPLSVKDGPQTTV